MAHNRPSSGIKRGNSVQPLTSILDLALPEGTLFPGEEVFKRALTLYRAHFDAFVDIDKIKYALNRKVEEGEWRYTKPVGGTSYLTRN